MAVLAAIGATGLLSATAEAHAFGVRYDLPLPMWMFLVGAGAAVALSFVGVSRWVRGIVRIENRSIGLLSPGATAVVARCLKGLSVALFLLILAAAFFGPVDTFDNFAPLFVWVIWWVGLAFLSALLGDLWAVANPWLTLFELFTRGRKASPRPYPERLGFWPAVLLFFCFAWLELISTRGEEPRTLGWIIVGYSVLTWCGMAVFGGRAWCRHAEAFSVFFGLFARFAPFFAKEGRLALRWPSAGLSTDDAVPLSGSVFVLTVLATVTFDGVLETPLWAAVLEWVSESRFLRPALLALQDAGFDLLIVVKTVGLAALVCIFVAAFTLFSLVVNAASGASKPLAEVMGWFVLSIVPIAIAYHLSHYFFYLMVAGQELIPVLSDPLKHGWDIFGTANYQIDIGIVNAQMVWYIALSAIVIGHMFSVFIAHVTAFRAYDRPASAVRSQYPMIALMVGYTMLSLWILSQPIISK